ncbi:hypothetical protein BJ944DRAFT_66958 [Cunninghamella echinulata]|nr:hypothetical protein BJ944DRAFT_66958 [Cunninghamella echinulata]
MYKLVLLLLVFCQLAFGASTIFTSPKENAVYHHGDKIRFAWKDYSSKNESITLTLGRGGKAHHWHPYKDIAHFEKPFPNSFVWKVPKNTPAERYFLVITDDTRYQPFSNYFEIKSKKN